LTAIGVTGQEGALEQGLAYHEASAGLVFIEAPTADGMMHRICQTIKDPLLPKMMEGGEKTPGFPFQGLKEMWLKMMIYPVSLHMVAIKARNEALALPKQDSAAEGNERNRTRKFYSHFSFHP
jgi:2-methylisocitrate lyase-like PEP mutase family enzyme